MNSQFEKLIARYEKAAERYEAACQEIEKQQTRLAMLQCGTLFPRRASDPWTGEEILNLGEIPCVREKGHSGPHSDHRDEMASESYLVATAAYLAASRAARPSKREAEEAYEALDDARCGMQTSNNVWPCVLEKGHSGAHECPTEMRIVG